MVPWNSSCFNQHKSASQFIMWWGVGSKNESNSPQLQGALQMTENICRQGGKIVACQIQLSQFLKIGEGIICYKFDHVSCNAQFLHFLQSLENVSLTSASRFAPRKICQMFPSPLNAPASMSWIWLSCIIKTVKFGRWENMFECRCRRWLYSRRSSLRAVNPLKAPGSTSDIWLESNSSFVHWVRWAKMLALTPVILLMFNHTWAGNKCQCCIEFRVMLELSFIFGGIFHALYGISLWIVC